MKKLFLIFIPLIFMSCSSQKLVEKTIQIKFKGTIQTSISNSAGAHPFNVSCVITTFLDCPPLAMYYRYDEEEDWILSRTSEDAEKISSTRIQLYDSHSFYPKKSIYYKIEMDGETIATFGKWLPKENWSDEFERYYTVYE